MTPKGKIGRLPFSVRMELHARKREGAPDVELLAWLNSLPEVHEALRGKRFGGKAHRVEISDSNLSDYFRPNGPYAEWIKGQEKVEKVQQMSEFALRLANVTGGNISRAGVAIAAGQIIQALEAAADEDRVKLAAAAAALCNADATATRADTDRQRLPLQRETVELERKKFHMSVARNALALFEDQQARAIAEGKGSREEKIQQLLAFMEKAEKED